MSDPPNREEAIFEDALSLPLEQRTAHLEKTCGDDVRLRQRIEKLLQAHDKAGNFMEEPVAPTADKTGFSLPPTEKTGDKIGHYKLLQQIGEGGCGVVYMAEQEEPVRRRVALKVIKLGMDTKSVIARFEAERQALALMDHPNIAKVLDAGATATGRPYFVMELVGGIKITDYCDQNNLPTKARLELFTQVCRAIQHAHQKGIIHRDIKPSNILVAMHDGVPVPKVIDFGIAKATGQRLTDKTLFTAFEQFIGTPAYMSPEQAERGGLDVDTRSDIYALGVLLYELLTGQPPFDPKELLAAGLEEMCRTIREKEPARPSTRLGTMLDAELTTVASHRQTEPPKLIHLLRGDLDWIVMKALEKDRARRYETAGGLATDIQHHLNNEPVMARPPSRFYRFQKLVRRNKLAFAATSAVIAALILGLGVSTWMFFGEKKARERAVAAEHTAQTEARKSQQVARFLKDMLAGVGPSVALGRDTTMLRDILDKTTERVDQDLKDEPEVQAELLDTLGLTYIDLVEYAKAEAVQRKALAIRQKLFGNKHPDVARSLDNLALVLERQRRLTEAETLAREAVEMQKELLGGENQDIAASMDHLANIFYSQGNWSGAETTHRQALAIKRKLLRNDVDSAGLAWSLNNLARTLWTEGKLDEAETLNREALAIRKKLYGNDHPEVALSLRELGLVLNSQGKTAEAEPLVREALAMQRKILGDKHFEVALSLESLAAVLQSQGKLDEAETLLREAVQMQQKLSGNEHADAIRLMHRLAQMLWSRRKLPEAETLNQELLALGRRLYGNTNEDVALSLADLGLDLLLLGKFPDAETRFREALAIRQKLFGGTNTQVATSLFLLGLALDDQGKFSEAEARQREALVMQRKLLDAEHPDVALTLSGLGRVLSKENMLDEAETSLNQAVTIQRKILNSKHPDLFVSLNELAAVFEKKGKLAEAASVRREAAENGDMRSQYALGLMYANGQGVPKDETEADKWFRKAAEQCRVAAEKGDTRSQFALGWMYAAGKGVAEDPTEAVKWYRKAAESGDVQALNCLAWLLATSDDSKVRDGFGAVGYAEKAVAATSRKNPMILDTLAAAYAEAGQFTNAVSIEQEAITLLHTESENTNYTSRLRLYESNTLYRERN